MHQLPRKASTGSTVHLLLAHQMDPTSAMLTESCQIASCLDKPPLWLTLASWRLFNPKRILLTRVQTSSLSTASTAYAGTTHLPLQSS